jgi:hypothetical protein
MAAWPHLHRWQRLGCPTATSPRLRMPSTMCPESLMAGSRQAPAALLHQGPIPGSSLGSQGKGAALALQSQRCTALAGQPVHQDIARAAASCSWLSPHLEPPTPSPPTGYGRVAVCTAQPRLPASSHKQICSPSKSISPPDCMQWTVHCCARQVAW